ncbi:SDR family NAD(P)-dependent oxidoreductase [Ferrimonas sediminicola]|uniref:SDR family NAD(P)-dependent oxidoreductase n=1 Tax=Ferrimonas sediminicola TaxID=2569538 RepID=A0A4U1BA16_9GAMM|nr:SDR family NAD(P)-dependent oxidoreductase [Ferrimonas sediminicola]TKB47353.1 SDR family NAD(P)-dependent oxidoreductase [Ferrimonas sediminicola]
MILITGAGSGLGAALAQLYSAQGESLVLVGRSGAKLEAVAASLAGEVICHPADLTCEVQVAGLFDELPQVPEKIIHCAGSGDFGALSQFDESRIRRLMDNNLLTAALVAKEAVARYAEQAVQLVMVASTAAQKGKANEAVYCAVKWGVKGLVESLRAELKGAAMTLVGVYPGGMDTPFWRQQGCDSHVDASGFMSAMEAAAMLAQGLIASEHGYISELTLIRR